MTLDEIKQLIDFIRERELSEFELERADFKLRIKSGAAVQTVSAPVVLTAKAGASSELMAKLLDAYAAEPDAVDVEVVLSPPGHQAPMLRDGRADVAILHRPFDDTSGFDVETLNVEDQVLILPAGHPVSRTTSLTVAEATSIPDLPPPRWPRLDGTYPDARGPEMRDLTQVLQLVRLGRASIVLPESSRINVGDGLAVVPVSDAAQVTTVIAWPPQSTSPAVAALVRAATATGQAISTRS